MEMWDTGLDAIAWSDLDHAYGDASDVPGLLRGLASDDPEQVQESLYELCGNIWHQGTIYEATSAAIPFLVKLYTSLAGEAREHVASLLMLTGGGKGFYEVHAAIGLRPEGDEKLEDVLAQERQHKAAVRMALNPVMKELAEYRGHSDSNLREFAFELIAENAEGIPSARKMLEDALEIESDERLQEMLNELLENWPA